ncbi:MAG TPA: hypothetical protein VNX26_06485 [Candidatus Acidoferrum sp.]|jgi:uncharacterized membrane protein YraQ (UPF0718 family)|nr:hypothetical protein [Candidatus Acidoferrum sp.]
MSSATANSPVSISIPLNAEPARRTLAVQSLVAGLLGLGIGLYFWIDSRYPALLKKLHSGKAIQMKGALSFDALMPVTPAMSLVTRIEHTTVNWMWTNRIGMTFGICFGAAMLTLLATLPRIRMKTAAGNTLLGAIGGMPLGVCANCVAPIGRSLFVAGASPNTVLAAMISSPMLNFVVMAMAFALFPLPIALVRLAVPIALLALVPLVAGKTAPQAVTGCSVPGSSGWLRPVTFTMKSYFTNLGRLSFVTVPLMVVAALLGAVAVELLPASSIPVTVTVGGIVLVALVGTFLPVPMGFDVAAAFLLMARGVPTPYVVTLLCTLGAYSIYSTLILGRTISWRTAATLFGAVMLLGLIAGVGTALVQHSL